MPSSILVAQEGLSAIYPIERRIVGADTLSSHLKGVVIDSVTFETIASATVEFYTTRGDALSSTTDSSGVFQINQLPSNCEIKLIFRGNESYKKREWQFTTAGLIEPIQLYSVFHLSKK